MSRREREVNEAKAEVVRASTDELIARVRLCLLQACRTWRGRTSLRALGRASALGASLLLTAVRAQAKKQRDRREEFEAAVASKTQQLVGRYTAATHALGQYHARVGALLQLPQIGVA